MHADHFPPFFFICEEYREKQSSSKLEKSGATTQPIKVGRLLSVRMRGGTFIIWNDSVVTNHQAIWERQPMHVKDMIGELSPQTRCIMHSYRDVPSFLLSYRFLILGFRVQYLIFPTHLVPSGDIQVSGRRRNKLTQVNYIIVHQCSGDR